MTVTNTNTNKQNNICNNCFKYGHQFHQCKQPITSYGIILIRFINNKPQYLIVQRKNSFGHIDFIRGKYNIFNIYQLKTLINEMTICEKEDIKTNTFDTLWQNMWGNTIIKSHYKYEEQNSKKKFESLLEGFKYENSDITLYNLLDESNTTWNCPEWEFPKGRRNTNETDIECALREFEEETGIPKNYIQIVDNILPFEELFIGSNSKSYKYKYFLAILKDDIQITDEQLLCNYQKSEISKIEWNTLDECLSNIRPYNLEKKELIQNINEVLNEYRLY